MRAISSSIRVYVNGTELGRDRLNGWEYIPDSNAIAFFGMGRPELADPANNVRGDSVVVVYDHY